VCVCVCVCGDTHGPERGEVDLGAAEVVIGGDGVVIPEIELESRVGATECKRPYTTHTHAHTHKPQSRTHTHTHTHTHKARRSDGAREVVERVVQVRGVHRVQSLRRG